MGVQHWCFFTPIETLTRALGDGLALFVQKAGSTLPTPSVLFSIYVYWVS